MAVAVAAPVVIGLDAEAGGGGDRDGGDAPLEVPLPVEVDRKGAPPVEGVRVPVEVSAGGDGKEKKDTEEEVKGEEGVDPVKWLGHYSSAQSILLVGDGDFSFSLALANAFGSGANLVPTSLDTYEALRSKYSKAVSNVAELKRLGATVFHGVDAKEMKLHPDLKNRRFDRIVFNLPHAGFTGKEDDVHMIKELVWGFFHNAIHLLRPYCEIHISHKIGRSYDKWGLEDLASGASLVLVDKVAFKPENYPGYNQKRGDSARCDESFVLDACFTFKFRIRELNCRKKLNGNMTSPISTLGILGQATERGPLHLFSPAGSWPRQHLPPRINMDQMVTTLEPCEVVRRQRLDFPLDFDGAVTVRDPYFHQEHNARPMLRAPGPSLQALPDPGGIPPPRGRVPCTDLIAPQEEHWHHHRSAADVPGRHHSYLAQEHQWSPQREHEHHHRSAADVPGRHHSYLAQEHQWSPQREHEIRGQVMPGSTSFGRSALVEHRHRDRESVEKQERLRLRRMVALYGGNQERLRRMVASYGAQ